MFIVEQRGYCLKTGSKRNTNHVTLVNTELKSCDIENIVRVTVFKILLYVSYIWILDWIATKWVVLREGLASGNLKPSLVSFLFKSNSGRLLK